MNLLRTKPMPNDVALVPVDNASLALLRERGESHFNNQLNASGFECEYGSTQLFYGPDGSPDRVLVGIQSAPQDPRGTVLLFAQIAAQLPAGLAFQASAENWGSLNWEQAGMGWGLAAYAFTRYMAKKPKGLPVLRLPESVDIQKINDQLAAVYLARDLINTPANDLGPVEFAEEARKIATSHAAEIRIISGEDLVKEGYPAIYEVGKGSVRPPALIDLRWGEASHPKLTLVGKGVVFDTGGLNLKSAAGMLLMKKDMGGGGITLALAQLVMARKLKVRLRLLIPAVENSAGPAAYRPSDVIQTRKGIRVEIGNTDAEGRVVLCDALAEAVEEKPDLILDMATLTGAARVAMGQDLPPFWTPDDQLAQDLEQAANQVADPVWRMPLWHPYRKSLKTKIADISNISNSPMGGCITAALYLYEFVKPFKNWIHMDVYGWRTEALPGSPEGGEATALRAVFRFLENRYGS